MIKCPGEQPEKQLRRGLQIPLAQVKTYGHDG
jgi:hypothetical protein